jgi:hypothetical protein
MRSPVPIFSLMLAAAAAPAAATDHVGQFWGQATASGPVAGRVIIWLEGQARAGQGGPDGFRQTLLRPAIGLRLGEAGSVQLGYAHVQTGDSRRLATEHRIWQQLAYTIATPAATTITGRTRFEQRDLPGAGGLALRLRQQVQLAVPIGERGVAALLWTEPFFNLNAPRPTLRTGLDRWRTQIGVRLPLTDQVALEPGYLAQYVPQPGENQLDHVAVVGFAIRW